MSRLIGSRAFSLPEFMAAASLVALLLYLSVPRISEVNETLAVRNEVSRLRAYMQELQIKAARLGSTFSIHLHQEFYQLLDEQNDVFNTIFLRQPLKILQTGDEVKELTFYPSGVMTPATVRVAGRYKQCSVVASLRGRMRTRC